MYISNLTGRHCEQCKENFYRDPTKSLDDPNVCIECPCVIEGTVNGTNDCNKHVNVSLYSSLEFTKFNSLLNICYNKGVL